ncbi:DMT family transporter [Thiofilum flexile]|uniref:DMT family transporter n=1 Tax=Thiofilum flexile TaxID=125627 RepID=UPI0003725D40|nr:DMT family transporter [Thiofilum flexile]
MPERHTTHYFQIGLLLAIIGTGLFALKSIFIKLAFAEGVDATTLLALRMLISAPFYLGVLIWCLKQPNTKNPSRPDWIKIIMLGFMGYYLASWLDMQGLVYITAQLERLTLYTYPIFTTLLSWLVLKETITKRVWLALVLTYTGVLVLYLHEAKLGGSNVTLGMLLVVGSALSYSFYVLFSKSFINQYGSRIFTSIAMLASSFFVVIHFFITHSFTDLLVSAKIFWYAALIAVVSTLLPTYMIAEAIQRIGPARTSIVGAAGPIFTIVIAVWLLAEPFGWFHLIGIGLVMWGVSLLGKK